MLSRLEVFGIVVDLQDEHVTLISKGGYFNKSFLAK